jgi:hypothetical protein
MAASRTRILVLIAILTSAIVVSGQTRSRTAPSIRRAPSPPVTIADQPNTTADSETTSDTKAPETVSPAGPAGRVIPPNGGYVPVPEGPQPGTAAPAAIPSDPLDRGYWELYDRERSVTLTGKVTRVDWLMPNTYIYLAAQGGLWAVESGFAQFRQASVMPAIHVDEVITITGYLPKDELPTELPAKRISAMSSFLKTNHFMRAGEITTVFGQKLNMGRPPSEKQRLEDLKCSPFGC